MSETAHHLPKLIQDLALICIAGAVTTIVFRLIKQPLVLGYILAGFLVGPYVHFLPSVVDHTNVETLADIGVIFLLFSLGLEFSFKKLVRVGGHASITALTEIVFITTAGFFVGKWLGWSFMDSIFLGGMLASSSTTIILRAFDELGVKTKQFAGIVFGVLVVEDIVVILLMVLLSTMAISQQFAGTELMFTVLRLAFFLLLWFLAGIFLIPTLLARSKKLLDSESLLILTIGLCLGMVVLATQVGFSAELGAFIMGSIIAETTSAERIEHLIKPVKDLFGAVFFVSVGMLIDPDAIIEHKWPVLLVTLLTIFGKLFSTTAGALISGQPLKQSVQVGMSMAQIGEFAFIVATLGLSLGVISDFLFPVAVGASAITTFTTPYMIRYSGRLHAWLERVLPARWLRTLANYSAGTQKVQADSDWKKVVKSYTVLLVTNGFLLVASLVLCFQVLLPILEGYIEVPIYAHIVSLLVTLAIAAPFLWGFMWKTPQGFAFKELWVDNRYSPGPLLMLEIVRNTLGVLVVAFLVFKIFSNLVALFIAVPLIIGALYIFSKRIRSFYHKIEGRFLSNLHSRENAVSEADPLTAILNQKNAYMQSNLAPWSAYIVDMTVGQLAPFAGRTLQELGWRETYGINVAYVKRGDKLIHAPGGNQSLLPFDHVGIIATEEQMSAFRPVFESQEQVESKPQLLEDIVLQKILVDEHNRLQGVDIRSSGIRENTNGLIIGIERDNRRILNPESSTVFQWRDVVWIVGDRKKIQQLTKQE